MAASMRALLAALVHPVAQSLAATNETPTRSVPPGGKTARMPRPLAACRPTTPRQKTSRLASRPALAMTRPLSPEKPQSDEPDSQKAAVLHGTDTPRTPTTSSLRTAFSNVRKISGVPRQFLALLHWCSPAASGNSGWQLTKLHQPSPRRPLHGLDPKIRRPPPIRSMHWGQRKIHRFEPSQRMSAHQPTEG